MRLREMIGPSGLWALVYGFMMGTAAVLPIGALAKQDAWLAVLVGGGAGLLTGLVTVGLAQLSPGQSLIGYSKRLLGPWFGGLVGLLYIWYGLHLDGLVLHSFAGYVESVLLPETPLVVPVLVMMAICVYSIRHGVEPMTRSVQIIVVTVIVIATVTIALETNKMVPRRLLPVLEMGVPDLLRASFPAFGLPFGEGILLAGILNHVQPLGAIRRAFLGGIAASAFTLSLFQVTYVTVLGPHLASTSTFPSLDTVRMIEVAEFLTRFDAVIVVTLVGTGLVKIAIILYVTTTGLTEWLGLSDYRPLTAPVGILVAILSMILFRNAAESALFPIRVFPFYSFPFQVLIPVFLLVVALIRRGRSPSRTG